jgi:Trm5-related predicted tRNA methylase
MTQERINEIVAILDRAKECDGISYALEQAVCELIREVKLLQDELKEYNCDTKIGCKLIEKIKAELAEVKKGATP